jgi:hypothetical protein
MYHLKISSKLRYVSQTVVHGTRSVQGVAQINHAPAGFPRVQTVSGVPPASYPMGIGDSLLGELIGRSVKLATHLYTVPCVHANLHALMARFLRPEITFNKLPHHEDVLGE